MDVSDEFPTLRLRATGPSPHDITELSLGGVDLLPLQVTSVKFATGPTALNLATLTFECVLDIDAPVSKDA